MGRPFANLASILSIGYSQLSGVGHPPFSATLILEITPTAIARVKEAREASAIGVMTSQFNRGLEDIILLMTPK